MSRTDRPGHLVVLEGLDGAGTTSQVERLANLFRAEGQRVVTTREPSDGPVGQLIRQALTARLTPTTGEPLTNETLALLFAADRADHLASFIVPKLKEGVLVLCDRYVLSSLAYQGLALPMAWVEVLNQRAPPADLTLFLSVDAKTASRRRKDRGAAQELFEQEELQARIGRQYAQAIRRRAAYERIVRIDGSRSTEQVTEDAAHHIRSLLAPSKARGR